MYLLPTFSSKARNSCCSFCGKGPGRVNPRSPISQDRQVISSEIEIDWEGSFEFCQDCAAEAGALVGMISKKKADELRKEADEARSLLAEEHAARVTAEEALSALLKYEDGKKAEDERAA